MVGFLRAVGLMAPGFFEGREAADRQRLYDIDIEGKQLAGEALKGLGGLGGFNVGGAPNYYGGVVPSPGEASVPMMRPQDVPGGGMPGWQQSVAGGGGGAPPGATVGGDWRTPATYAPRPPSAATRSLGLSPGDVPGGESWTASIPGAYSGMPEGMPTRSPGAPEVKPTSGGWLPGAGGPDSGKDPRLAEERKVAASQLMTDPAAMERLYRTVSAEDPRGLVPQIEEILNRGAARDQSVKTASSDPNFYPQRTQQYRGGDVPRDQFVAAVQQVLGGSNVTQYATDNASGGVGLGWGNRSADPYTVKTASGERYGPAKRDMPWVLERTGGAAPVAAPGSAPYPGGSVAEGSERTGETPGNATLTQGGGRVTTDPRTGMPQMDVPTLAQRIMQARPNARPEAVFSALNQLVPLLNADGKVQLAQMRSMDAEDRLRFLYSREQRLDEQAKAQMAFKEKKLANEDELRRYLEESKRTGKVNEIELAARYKETLKNLDWDKRQELQGIIGRDAMARVQARIEAEDTRQQRKLSFEEESGGNVKTMMLRKYRREFEARENRKPTPEEEQAFVNNMQPPSATELKNYKEDQRYQSAIEGIDDVLDDIRTSYRPGGVNPVGAVGAAMRLGEMTSNLMGWSDESAAHQFESKINALLLQVPNLLTGRTISNAQDRERATKIVRGVQMGDTRQITMGDLEWLRDQLNRQRPGTVPGRTAPLVKPSDEDTAFRVRVKKEHPEMSDKEIDDYLAKRRRGQQ